MPDTDTRHLEPTLAAMCAAAEAARTANHCAYEAPGDPAALYDRVAALHDLIVKTKQLAQVLAEACTKLTADPPIGMYAADGSLPIGRSSRAAVSMTLAADGLHEAERYINLAWSELSVLGIREVR